MFFARIRKITVASNCTVYRVTWAAKKKAHRNITDVSHNDNGTLHYTGYVNQHPTRYQQRHIGTRVRDFIDTGLEEMIYPEGCGRSEQRYTLNDMKALLHAAGGVFFDASHTTGPGRSIIASRPYHGFAGYVYLITSDLSFGGDSRVFKVWRWHPTVPRRMHHETTETTLADAREAARLFANTTPTDKDVDAARATVEGN